MVYGQFQSVPQEESNSCHSNCDKEIFCHTINRYVKEESEKLSVFQQSGVYLATKKIGKNNPKAEEIKADNAATEIYRRMGTKAFTLFERISQRYIFESDYKWKAE